MVIFFWKTDWETSDLILFLIYNSTKIMIVIVNICKMDHDISLVRILFKKKLRYF